MRVDFHLGVASDQRDTVLSFVKIWWWSSTMWSGGGSSEVLAGPLAGGLRPRWETDMSCRQSWGIKFICLSGRGRGGDWE